MNTHDIELPPLPTPPSLIQRKDWYGAIQAYARSYGMECARAAIEADRKHFAETLSALSGDAAGMYEQECDSYFNGLSDGYDYAAQVLRGEEKSADRKRGGEPKDRRDIRGIVKKLQSAYVKDGSTDEWVRLRRHVLEEAIDTLRLVSADCAHFYESYKAACERAPQPAEPVSVPEHLIERLRKHCENKDNTAFARSTMREALQYLTAESDRGEPVATVRHFHYEGIARNGPSQEAVMIDGAPMLPEGTQLYAAPQPAEPSGYAYRYRHHDGGTVIRFNDGREVNGSRPIEALPYWFAPQPAEPAETDSAGYTLGPTSDGGMDPRNTPAEPAKAPSEDQWGTLALWLDRRRHYPTVQITGKVAGDIADLLARHNSAR